MGFAALYPSYPRMTAQGRTKLPRLMKANHRRGALVCGAPYRASTSTSPSTPVMTLKLRS
jgi:hypothetical protein